MDVIENPLIDIYGEGCSTGKLIEVTERIVKRVISPLNIGFIYTSTIVMLHCIEMIGMKSLMKYSNSMIWEKRNTKRTMRTSIIWSTLMMA